MKNETERPERCPECKSFSRLHQWTLPTGKTCHHKWHASEVKPPANNWPSGRRPDYLDRPAYKAAQPPTAAESQPFPPQAIGTPKEIADDAMRTYSQWHGGSEVRAPETAEPHECPACMSTSFDPKCSVCRFAADRVAHNLIVRGLAACDVLARAVRYLAKQYSYSMTRDQAEAHFEARALLLRRENALLDEMELEYKYGRDAEVSDAQ